MRSVCVRQCDQSSINNISCETGAPLIGISQHNTLTARPAHALGCRGWLGVSMAQFLPQPTQPPGRMAQRRTLCKVAMQHLAKCWGRVMLHSSEWTRLLALWRQASVCVCVYVRFRVYGSSSLKKCSTLTFTALTSKYWIIIKVFQHLANQNG